ncbi:MAG: radical SAM/SPASM domain-containing protein [Bacteroidota bacterium]
MNRFSIFWTPIEPKVSQSATIGNNAKENITILKQQAMWFSLRARINNILQYQKAYSGKRALNFLLLLVSHYQSRFLGRPVVRARPYALSVEPTPVCQLRCPECPTGAEKLTRPTGIMPFEQFSKIIEATHPFVFYLNLYFQGEPLLHPQIGTFVRKARQRNIYTTISTNGQKLNEKMCSELIDAGLSRIVISFDGYTQPVYETYRRNGNVETVKTGISELLRARKKAGTRHPLVVVQCLALSHNRHEIPEIKQWCRKQGVDKLEIKRAQINEFGDGNVTPDKRKSRYKTKKNGQYQIKGHARNHCWRQWSSAVVTWNGTVVPCCYDKNAEHPMGDFANSSLDSIWFNLDANEFRNAILTNRSSISMCRNCPEGRS